ncbi:MAG: hypothetical protein ACYC0F_00615 [Rhodanobacter sp.]
MVSRRRSSQSRSAAAGVSVDGFDRHGRHRATGGRDERKRRQQ